MLEGIDTFFKTFRSVPGQKVLFGLSSYDSLTKGLKDIKTYTMISGLPRDETEVHAGDVLDKVKLHLNEGKSLVAVDDMFVPLFYDRSNYINNLVEILDFAKEGGGIALLNENPRRTGTFLQLRVLLGELMESNAPFPVLIEHEVKETEQVLSELPVAREPQKRQ